MAKSEVLKAIIDIDVKGAQESISQLDKIADSFDSQRLKAQTNDLKAQLEGLFKYLEKVGTEEIEFDFKDSGLKENIRKLASFIDANFTSKLDKSVQDQIKSIEEQMGIAAQKAAEYGHRAKQLFDEIALEKKKLEAKAETGHFGFKIDPGLVENVKSLNRQITAVGDEINKLKGKEKSDKDRLKIVDLEKEQAALEAFAIELEKSRKEWATKGRSRGGLLTQEGKALDKKEALGLEKAEIQKSGIPKEVSDLQKSFEGLIKVIEKLGRVQRAVHSDETAKKIAKNTEEVKKTEEAVIKLDKAEVQHEKTLGRKLISGLSYHTVFNKVRQLLNASIRSIEQLDKAMTKAAIVTSMTRQESWHLLKSYQNLAKETGKTTAEIANLNAFFLQQGKTIKQAAEMTEAAAKSAAVAGTSLQDAANYITSAIHGFGLAADQAEFVADKFAALGAASASNFEEIAIAMSKVAPVAQSAGVGIDFMMAILAKGIHTTREAPEAIGTAMKTIFARMRELTDIGKATEDGMSLNRVEKALNSIGVDLRDVTGQFRNLEDVLMDVGYKWKDLDSVQQAYLATALAGTRQQPRLLAILNDFETTVDFIEISKQSQDELMYQHMDFLEGMEAATNQMKNSWEELTTAVVDSDLLIGLYQTLANTVSGLAGIVEFLVKNWGLLIPILAVSGVLLTKKIADLGKSITLQVREYAYQKILAAEEAKRYRAGQAGIQKLIKQDERLVRNKQQSLIITKQLRTEEEISAAQKRIGVVLSQKEAFAIGRSAKAKAENALKTGIKTRAERQEILTGLQVALTNGLIEKSEYDVLFARVSNMALAPGYIGTLKAIGAAAWASLGPYAILAGAIAGVVAISKTLIHLWKKNNRTVKQFGQSIQEAGKKIHDAQKKIDDLNKSIDAFDRLNKKVIKNNEDLEEMRQILDDIQNFTDGEKEYNFVITSELTGERSIDYDAIRAYQKEIKKAQNKEMAIQYEDAGRAVVKHGFKKALEDHNIKRVFVNYGETIAKSMSDSIGSLETQNMIRNVYDNLISNLDFASFQKEGSGYIGYEEIGVLRDNWIYHEFETWEELYEWMNQDLDVRKWDSSLSKISTFDIEEYRKFMNEVVALESEFNKLTMALTKDSLSMQLDAFENLLDSAEGHERIQIAIRETNKDLNDMLIIMYGLGTTSKGLEDMFINLGKRGLNNKEIIDLFESFGLFADGKYIVTKDVYEYVGSELKKVGEEEIDDYGKYYKEKTDLVKEYTIEIGRLEDEQKTLIFKKDKTGADYQRLEDIEKEIALLEDLKDETQELIQLDPLDYYKGDYIRKNQEEFYDMFSKGIDTDFIDKHFDDLVTHLLTNTPGLNRAEAEQAAYQVLGAFTFSADQIGNKFVNIGNVVNDALDLPNKLKKGDFNSLFALMDEVGEEVFEEFQKSGDVEDITKALFKDSVKEVENRIHALEKLGESRTEIEEEELMKLKLIQPLLNDITLQTEVWNKALENTGEIIKRINNNISFIDKLQDLNINLGEDSIFEKIIDNQIEAAEQAVQKNMEDQRKERNRALAAIPTELLNADGTIKDIPSEGIVGKTRIELDNLISNYHDANDRFLDSSNQYIEIIELQIDRFKKEQEKLKKEIEDSHKERMDLLKKQYDEKWAAIDYENKLISLQEKITEARNKMATAMYVGDLAAQEDAQKLMREARENRQKEIEKQILDKIQAEEEAARNRRIEEINESIDKHIQELSESFKEYLESFDNSVEIQKIIAENTSEIAENTSETTEEIRSSGKGGLGRGGSDSIKQISLLDGGGGVR